MLDLRGGSEACTSAVTVCRVDSPEPLLELHRQGWVRDFCGTAGAVHNTDSPPSLRHGDRTKRGREVSGLVLFNDIHTTDSDEEEQDEIFGTDQEFEDGVPQASPDKIKNQLEGAD